MWNKKKTPTVIGKSVQLVKEVSIRQSRNEYGTSGVTGPPQDGESLFKIKPIYYVAIKKDYSDGSTYTDYRYCFFKNKKEAETIFDFLVKNKGNSSIKEIQKETQI